MLLALRGSAWTVAGYGASQLLRLAGQLILARALLTPQAFGLVALVSVFLSGLDMLSDLGIGTDVVQHFRGDDPVFVNTAFLIQAVRGLVLWGIAAALAHPFASFYQQPAVEWMIFVAAASIGFRNLASGSIWTMTRHVQLGKLTLLSVLSDAAGLAVSIAWAIVLPTAWALVAGRVAGAAVYMIGSHLIAAHPVSLKWDSSAARSILAFGTGMFLSSATYFLSTEGERLAIGKYITVAELGCFSLAVAMAWAPSRALQQVIGQVFFPMIARAAREDRQAAVRDYRKVRLLVTAASVALGCGFILFGPLFVRLLLGDKYVQAGWMLQLLGFRAAVELFSSCSVSMLFAIGSSRYAAIGNTAKLVFLSVGLAVAFARFGFREAVWVLALSQLAHYVPQLCGLRRSCEPAVKSEAVCFAILLLAAGASAATTRAV